MSEAEKIQEALDEAGRRMSRDFTKQVLGELRCRKFCSSCGREAKKDENGMWNLFNFSHWNGQSDGVVVCRKCGAFNSEKVLWEEKSENGEWVGVK